MVIMLVAQRRSSVRDSPFLYPILTRFVRGRLELFDNIGNVGLCHILFHDYRKG